MVNSAPLDKVYVNNRDDKLPLLNTHKKTNQDKLHSIITANKAVDASYDSDSSDSSDSSYNSTILDEDDDWGEPEEKYRFVSSDYIGKFYLGSITVVCLFVLYRLLNRGKVMK
jgi:hypothetical protein